MRLLAWILFGIPALLTAQDAIISADNLNILYVGVSNPVSIAIPNVPFEKTALKTSCGTVSKQNGKYTIHITSRTSANATVSIGRINKKDTQWIYSKVFRIEKLLPPTIYLGNIHPAQPLPKKLLQVQHLLTAIMAYAPYEGIKFTVKSYSVYFFSQKFGFRKINSNSASLSPLAESLNTIAEGDFMVFDSIIYEGPDHQYYQAEPITYFTTANSVPNIYVTDVNHNKLNVTLHPKLANSIRLPCELLFEFPYENTFESPMATCTTKNDIQGNLTYRYSEDRGDFEEWELKNGLWHVLNDDSILAVGNVIPVHGYFDTTKMSLPPISQRSEYERNTDAPAPASKGEIVLDTNIFLYRFFNNWNNQYLPIGRWTFYYKSKVVAAGEIELGKQFYKAELAYPIDSDYRERPYHCYNFPPALRYGPYEDFLTFTIIYYNIKPGSNFHILDPKLMEELTDPFTAK